MHPRKRLPNVISVLGQRLRRWPSIETTSGQRVVFSGTSLQVDWFIIGCFSCDSHTTQNQFSFSRSPRGKCRFLYNMYMYKQHNNFRPLIHKDTTSANNTLLVLARTVNYLDTLYILIGFKICWNFALINLFSRRLMLSFIFSLKNLMMKSTPTLQR